MNFVHSLSLDLGSCRGIIVFSLGIRVKGLVFLSSSTLLLAHPLKYQLGDLSKSGDGNLLLFCKEKGVW